MRKCPWLVGSVREASSSVFFSDRVPSGSERFLFGLLANCSLSVYSLPKNETRKNSSLEEEGINALCLDWSISG